MKFRGEQEDTGKAGDGPRPPFQQAYFFFATNSDETDATNL
jgi:hypothetical protein